MEKLRWILILLGLFLLLSSCADSVPYDVLVTDEPYGFWSGIWHGIIAPFSFIGSLIWDDISMYAVNNTGGWYDFGFWIAIGGLGQFVGVIGSMVNGIISNDL